MKWIYQVPILAAVVVRILCMNLLGKEVTEVLSQLLQHPGRAQRDPGALVPPALTTAPLPCPCLHLTHSCLSVALRTPRVDPITTMGVSWQVNFFLFLNIVRVLASKLWETTTGKLDPRQQYRQVQAAPKPRVLPVQPGWLPMEDEQRCGKGWRSEEGWQDRTVAVSSSGSSAGLRLWSCELFLLPPPARPLQGWGLLCRPWGMALRSLLSGSCSSPRWC